jgi:diacylglycerol kinase (ATP)
VRDIQRDGRQEPGTPSPRWPARRLGRARRLLADGSAWARPRAGHRPDVHFSIIPIGSANDYAHSLGLDSANGPPASRAVDVGRVRSPQGRQEYFGCNLGMGLNGAVTREARRIHRLQGMALYGMATLRALYYHFRSPPMTLRIDNAPPWQSRTLLFSVLVGRREGGFVLAPRAEIDDGWLDYIHAADLSRWQVVQLLPRIALFGAPEEYPKIRQGRCRRVLLQSDEPLLVHTDGEFFCLPEDNVRELDIDLLPGALTVEAGLLQ